MSHSREEVLELLAAKRISSGEADRLLGALESGKRSVWTWAFNPLARISSGMALGLTAIPLVTQLALERAGIHFAGLR